MSLGLGFSVSLDLSSACPWTWVLHAPSHELIAEESVTQEKLREHRVVHSLLTNKK